MVIAVVLITDVIARAIATSALASELPFRSYPTLHPVSSPSALVQWAIILLVFGFFGGAGIAVGAAIGVFAVPAIVFLIWDLVVPFLGQNDPRNWFVILGHPVFNAGGGFQLAQPIPVAEPIALAGTIVGAVVLVAVGYVCIRLRNPLAT